MRNAIGIPLLDETEYIDERNDALLKAAYLYGVPAFIYNPCEVNAYPETGCIRALFWDGGEYRKCETDVPKYTELYCGCSAWEKMHPDEMKWIYEHTVNTDSGGLVKYELQRRLLFSGLSRYAVPTVAVRSYAELLSAAAPFRKTMVKPYEGRQASGVMLLENREGRLLYTTPGNSGVLTREALLHYYASCGYEESAVLLLEPCLNILNAAGRAVDFRCLVSLNGEGKWQNVLTYARIGGSGVASNIAKGGSYNFAYDTLEELMPGNGKKKLEEIETVALDVAAFVQKESSGAVSWLGLDICVDLPSGQVYVIEANTKPGMKLVGQWQFALVRAQYFKYLLSQSDPVC